MTYLKILNKIISSEKNDSLINYGHLVIKYEILFWNNAVSLNSILLHYQKLKNKYQHYAYVFAYFNDIE